MRRIVLMALMVLLISACKVKVEQGFELKADGSGEAVMIVGFDQELQDMIASSGAPDPFAAMTADVPPGWTSEEWTQGEFKGFRATAAFSDVAALQSLVDSDFSGEDGLFESFSIVELDGGYRVDGVLSGESLEQNLQGAEGFDFSATADEMVGSFFEASIAIDLPGKVVSHNADEVLSGGTLVWNVGVADAGGVIRAESMPGGALPVLPLAGAAAAVAALVAGFVVWSRRRPPTNPIGRLVYDESGKPHLVSVDADTF